MGCELLFIVNREDTFLAIQGGIWVISLPLLTSVLGMYWSSINASVNFDALGNYCPKTLVAQSINWLLPALPVRTYTFMLHQCNPLKFSKHSYAVYHCLGFDSLETVWDADSCASIYWGSAFRRNLKWNKGGTTGQGKRPGQDVGSADPMGSFWSMNYTTKLSYPEVRGLAISVYYWCWATFGKGSNLGISRQVLSHRLRTILRRMQLGALNNPSSEQLGDLLQSFQVFAYTIHSMKKQQPLLLCYCLKTCPNIVVFKPYLGNLPIHSYPHHPSPSWISTLFPSLTLYALIILFGIILLWNYTWESLCSRW